MNATKILYIFTRTPLHVGAGASVGAIDQPVIRERHTNYPVIPASSLKGSFADQWAVNELSGQGNRLEVPEDSDDPKVTHRDWLFGSGNDKLAFAGALQFAEAKLLAFPVRSAKGSFAWITSPLILRRAARDGVLPAESIKNLIEPTDEQAIFISGKDSKIALEDKLVLEDYTFSRKNEGAEENDLRFGDLGKQLAGLLTDDVWKEVGDRLVILSNGMMSFFARTACEVAQHVRIDDETGTAVKGGLFNQENVPSETLFYSVVRGFAERTPRSTVRRRPAEKALEEFEEKLKGESVFQFGGDASTGLGYCTVQFQKNGKGRTNQ
ncbi:MAG: hypothetical protein M2R45_03540 [Verrucomicrobia subdivision 3 bacterium]|nr:hypothetical protein [Limisphaerales bacterium]MCS1416483.1 hypothetical protein [Limisphaerales bacterium]